MTCYLVPPRDGFVKCYVFFLLKYGKILIKMYVKT